MNEGAKPRLIVVAGPNGTGKTSITEQLLRHEWMGGCVYINPDFIISYGRGSVNQKLREHQSVGTGNPAGD